jgi:hypothetical protein
VKVLIKLKIPINIVLLKAQKADRENSYMMTYEYGWSKSNEAANMSESAQETKSDTLDLLPSSFSVTLSFLSRSVRRVQNGSA